jgi:MFS family permease
MAGSIGSESCDDHEYELRKEFGGRPLGLSWRAHSLFIISTVVIGLFGESFVYGMVVPVLPFILQGRVGTPHDDLQGYSSALLAAYAGSSLLCSPIAGAVADRSNSRKGPFMFGMFISTAARTPNLKVSRHE